MFKKIAVFFSIILLIITIYMLQIYVIDSRNLFGVKPNLILISVIVVSLWYGLYVGAFYSLIIGFLSDCIFGNTIGLFTISYTFVGILIGYLNYNYRKENSVALIYVTILATFIFELLECICYIFINHEMFNLIYFAKQVILASLLNICICCIIYKILYNITDYIDRKLQINNSYQSLR